MSSRIVGGLVGVVVASAAVAGPAAAQYRAAQAQQRPLNFEVGAGPSVPLGSADKALTTGVNVLAAATLHHRTLPFGVRGAISYQHFGAKTGRVDPVTTIRRGNGQIFGGTLGAILDVPTGVLRPYVLGGVGYYGFRSKRSVSQLVGGDATVVSTVRQSDSNWGFNAGLGMRGGLGALDAFLEVRLDDMRTESGAFGSQRLRVVPVTLGVRF
jgi:hypothetical protein